MHPLVSESEAFKALADGAIFPFYQPVVNRDKHILGYELLMRWQIGDDILSPAAFMANFHSSRLWQQLTEMMVHSAINTILHFRGSITFAVNLPDCLLYEDWIEHIMGKARYRLVDKALMSRLVFEISEQSILTDLSEGARAIALLRENGCRVYLDDCFGETSVIFPVKNIPLDGFKIDKSIADTFQNNTYHEHLIRSLIYFCCLNQTICIAEGVDVQDKFEALAALGINAFQGYLIGKPEMLSFD
ncbi:EAL domain-containing protein [Hafnia alvei]|uniref:EAL domain-containing protein n=1 Tax=Hafnia alvei TaxID=569 RepID=UPI00345D5E78